jgi:pimeloyl-ACP methyl ester carboxylesterase
MDSFEAAPPALLARADGVRLAYRHRAGAGPTIVFLPGYMSDMEGGKAVAIDAWAAKEGRAMLRLDYAGNGASEGRFEDGTLASWRDDALLLIDTLTQGPLLLVGSSMGGWLALLIALARRDRVAGLVGIAAAPDFTEWGFTDADKALLATEGKLLEPTPYSDSHCGYWDRKLRSTVPFGCSRGRRTVMSPGRRRCAWRSDCVHMMCRRC